MCFRKLELGYFHKFRADRATVVASRSIWFNLVKILGNFVLLYWLTYFSNYARIHKVWKWTSWKFPISYQSASLQFVCHGKFTLLNVPEIWIIFVITCQKPICDLWILIFHKNEFIYLYFYYFIVNLHSTDKSRFKKLQFKKESWFKKDCCNNNNFSNVRFKKENFQKLLK